MLGRVVLAALLAGIAAGLIMGVIQHVRLTPLIIEAEKYETADTGHDHDATGVETANQAATSPATSEVESGGWRTALTFASSSIAGAGFAAILCGVSFLAGIPITRRNSLLWGLAGFTALSLAPAAGLPPELPGVPAADLGARQLWWVATAVCTAAGLWLLTQRREVWAIAAALAVIAAPHIIGAPQSPEHETSVPATLLAHFVANSLAANGLFWILIGTFLGLALPAPGKFQEQ